jgi:hypothetical protein
VLFAAITVAVLVVPPMAMFVDRWEWVWPEYFFLVSVNFALAVGSRLASAARPGRRSQLASWHAAAPCPGSGTRCGRPRCHLPGAPPYLQVYLYITPFSIPFLVFSVGIGYFKLWAMLSGLLGSERSKSWKVRGCVLDGSQPRGACRQVGWLDFWACCCGRCASAGIDGSARAGCALARRPSLVQPLGSTLIRPSARGHR